MANHPFSPGQKIASQLTEFTMLEDHINVDNPNDDLEKAVAHHSYKSVFSASWGID